MQLDCTQTPDLMIVHVREARIDAAGAIDFKDRMRDLVTAEGGRVLLDLSQVTFIDSSGLGAVVAVRKALGPERPLELAGLTPAVEKVFRLTRMDTVFTIRPALSDIAAGTQHAL
ncbi:STAS domain-containing protein [Pseudotabrizicola algicola]|uniref:STAS domain-containing protein n=1 Tax=Pseudotabrizicola algicola TaxID=2709381 RepID=A0A6B3RLR3_9RHOB|nr:STAS domain-containing protein [Pseudotabrizicola algicola]NEX46103.1 STAS domain-containing protein [Pseudotabrizicola algicola]